MTARSAIGKESDEKTLASLAECRSEAAGTNCLRKCPIDPAAQARIARTAIVAVA